MSAATRTYPHMAGNALCPRFVFFFARTKGHAALAHPKDLGAPVFFGAVEPLRLADRDHFRRVRG